MRGEVLKSENFYETSGPTVFGQFKINRNCKLHECDDVNLFKIHPSYINVLDNLIL